MPMKRLPRLAAVAALLASVFPARRAVRTPPVEALAEA